VEEAKKTKKSQDKPQIDTEHKEAKHIDTEHDKEESKKTKKSHDKPQIDTEPDNVDESKKKI